MKKIISSMLIITMIFAVFFASGCKKEEEISLEDKVDSKLTAYRTDIEDSIDTLNTPRKVCQYLTNWASTKGIEYEEDDYNNVIMEIETSESYASAPPTVVICPYDSAQMSNSVAPMAVGMYLSKNNEETGRLKVIFVDNTGNEFTGIKHLSGNYFTKNSKVFCLSSNSKSYWSVKTGSNTSYEFKGNLEYTQPTKNKAFKISITGLPGGIPDASISSYPNPIKRLGNLLAQFKTNALIYEVADFEGGTSGSLYPSSATMTVLIDEDDFDKFQKRIDKDIEKFDDKIKGNIPEASYTYEEVKIPKRVFTSKTMNNFVSFVYTLLDGAYYSEQDEESNELYAFTNIGQLVVNNSGFIIRGNANGITKDYITEINNNYQLICGLSNVEFKKTEGIESWEGNPESDFVYEVESAYNSYSNKKFKLHDYIPATNTSYIARLNKRCDIISLSVSGKGLDNYAGTILKFLMDQPHDDSSLKLKILE